MMVPTLLAEIWEAEQLKTKASIVSDTSGVWHGFNPFEKDQEIRVWQAFACGSDRTKFTNESKVTKVKVVDKLGKPAIIGTLCPGTPVVSLVNLQPGARVFIYEKVAGDLKEIAVFDTPYSNVNQLVPPLEEGQIITARMQLCGEFGELSNEVPVKKGISDYKMKIATAYVGATYISVMGN